MAHIFSAMVVLLAALTLDDSRTPDQPAAVFNEYLTSLQAGEWAAAESCWHPDLIQASRRLGITYAGIQAKYDCASPVLGALDFIRRGEVDVSVGGALDHGGWAELPVTLAAPEDSIAVSYYLMRRDGQWRLASLPFIASRRWPVIETRYTMVFYHDSTAINREALRRLDAFVASAGRTLAISPARMEQLAAEKIAYYLCDDAAMEQWIGPAAQGMVDLQFDALITRHLPHEHELMHVLLNYALGNLPLHTIPFMQEGAAVCLGGRWGKSPEVVILLGRFALDEGLVSAADILTFDGFHLEMGTPDLSYAVSGLLCRFLIEEFGIDRFLQLYRKLSDASATVRTMSRAHIEAAIAEICGVAWFDIQRKFADYWSRFESAGLHPGFPPDQGAELCRLASPHLTATIHESAFHLSLEIETDGSRPQGIILIENPSAPVEGTYRSQLFARHLPQAEYQGEQYGIWFTDQEAGLYDYHSNTLIAKYMHSFSSAAAYWDPERLVIRFYLDKTPIAGDTGRLRFRMAER